MRGEDREPKDCCETCNYYRFQRCGYVCQTLYDEVEQDELDAMSDDEFMQKFGKEPDDACDMYEMKDYVDPKEWKEDWAAWSEDWKLEGR